MIIVPNNLYMNIDKSLLKQLWSIKPWNKIENMFKDIPACPIPKYKTLTLDQQQWIEFSIENFDNANQSYDADPGDVELGNLLKICGRDKGNTFSLMYGMHGDSNKQLVSLIGDDNLKLLGLDPQYCLTSLIVKFAGHGVPWHNDNGVTYKRMFPDLNLDENLTCDKGTMERFWFPIFDWSNGHVFQISNTVISNWRSGDTYIIPKNQPHASSNFGYMPQYSVSLSCIK